MGVVGKIEKLKVYVNKSILLEVSKSREYGVLNVQWDGESTDESDCLSYLLMDLILDRRMEAQIE